MANSNLTNAKRAKNDEFYTQYGDIEKEIGAYLEYGVAVWRQSFVDRAGGDYRGIADSLFVRQGFKRD
jgi:hypothetical protein